MTLPPPASEPVIVCVWLGRAVATACVRDRECLFTRLHVALEAPKIHLTDLTATRVSPPLSRNHDPVPEDNPQASLRAGSPRRNGTHGGSLMLRRRRVYNPAARLLNDKDK